MPKVDLSVIIPARSEMWLSRTVRDITTQMRGNTEVIIGCDGNWPDPPIEDHPRVHMVYHSTPIGQRAISNECVRISRAKYVCKVDAHCAFDEGFDVKLMQDMQDDWTMVPVMRNFHVFDWVCKKCGDRRYQGPTPTSCPKCDNTTDFERDVVWIAKTNPQSASYCFDPEPHFQYFREFKKRPDGRGDLTETMSLQGSCFMVTRDKWWELSLCDEQFGSWGSQGIEVAVKTWLSGGRVVCSHKTWYAHLFRTQGGDFGFPYAISGRQVDRAKKHAKELFFNSKWEKQIKPLSWLIEKFWPVPGWKDYDLEQLKMFEASSKFSTLITSPPASDGVRRSKGMSPQTGSLPTINAGGSTTSHNVLSGQSKKQVSGIATNPVIADMVKDGNVATSSVRDRTNKPSVNKSVDVNSLVVKTGVPVSISVDATSPQPASGSGIKIDFPENLSGLVRGDARNNEKTHTSIISPESDIVKGLCFYTDNKVEPVILNAVKIRLQASMNSHKLVTVSQKPLDFGENIVMDLQRGHLAMAKQQLAGLEALNVDIVFMVEHDILYPPCHFDFVPPRKDTYYYNLNWWKVRMSDGQALHFKAKQVSGLCAYRDILIEYYRNRVRMIESGEIGGRRHFEPGSHYRDAYSKLTPHGFETWWSEVPYVDIRHDTTITRNIFDPSGYRGQVVDWTMQDFVPGWGVSKGRFQEFLKDAIQTQTAS